MTFSELLAGNMPGSSPKATEMVFMADPTLMAMSKTRQPGQKTVPEFGKPVSRPSNVFMDSPTFLMSAHLVQVPLH